MSGDPIQKRTIPTLEEARDSVQEIGWQETLDGLYAMAEKARVEEDEVAEEKITAIIDELMNPEEEPTADYSPGE